MIEFHKPQSLPTLFRFIETVEEKKYYLAGGTDLNIQINNRTIESGTIIYINHLQELKGIKDLGNDILIGSLTSYLDLLNSETISTHLPWFRNSLRYFASPALQAMATIGGNIANGSPTADVLPLLLALEARLKLLSKSKLREVPVEEFFKGYKQNILKRNEIIGAVVIAKDAESGFHTFYRKVASRRALTIAKLALAGLMKKDGDRIAEIRLGAGALNEYPRRLRQVENYMTGKEVSELDLQDLETFLKREITPITDLRSDRDYRFRVTVNLIREFIGKA